MESKMVLAGFIFLLLVVGGALVVAFPAFFVKTTALNTLKKKPTKAQIRRYRISGVVYIVLGIVLITITFLGGFKGV